MKAICSFHKLTVMRYFDEEQKLSLAYLKDTFWKRAWTIIYVLCSINVLCILAQCLLYFHFTLSMSAVGYILQLQCILVEIHLGDCSRHYNNYSTIAPTVLNSVLALIRFLFCCLVQLQLFLEVPGLTLQCNVT